MKSLYKYMSIVLITVLLTDCSEEITLKTDFEPQIFIFGNLTNEAKNLIVLIQESVPVENTSKDPKPVKNAKITLYTKSSNGTISIVTNDFIEKNETYTSSQIIDPIIGNFYWIEVMLNDGTIFKSTEEKLKTPVPIGDIIRSNGLVKVSFKDPADDKNFYRLDAKGIYSRYGEFSQLADDTLFNGNDDAYLEVDDVGGNEVQAVLLNLNYFTYQFYFNLASQEEAIEEVDDEDEEESGGGGPSQLFNPPPVHLTGNILNIITNRKALGNFGVISISFSSIEF